MIIGVGPPRSGTTSLAKLLDGCKGADVSHEGGPRIFWDDPARELERSLQFLSRKGGKYCGDVASSWLPALRHLKGRFDVTLLALIREPESWLESVTEHFSTATLTGGPTDKVPHFPLYPHMGEKKAWMRYRREYYQRLFRLDVQATMIQTAGLSCKKVQEVVFDAARIEEDDRRHMSECHYNKAKWR